MANEAVLMGKINLIIAYGMIEGIVVFSVLKLIEFACC